MDRATARIKRHEPARDRGWVGRAFHIRHLAPAVAAPDHPRRQHRQPRPAIEPLARDTAEGGGIASRRKVLDAPALGAPIDERAISAEQIGPQR